MKDQLTVTEENYIKAIYQLSVKLEDGEFVHTNSIANEVQTSAASVTDMIKKLSVKNLVNHQPYKGVRLRDAGNSIAKKLIRRHRLWEVFLLQILKFKWDEVHDMAEQLEHIQSDELTDRLDTFLGNPRYDPHGDPIPDKDGNILYQTQSLLSEMEVGEKGKIIGVKQHSKEFLQYLESMGLLLQKKIEVLEKFQFDESLEVLVEGLDSRSVSKKVCENLFIQKD